MVLDRLSAAEQRLLEQTRRDPDDYGILRPHADTNLTVKSVSRDTALLLYTLAEPNFLPSYAIDQLGERCDSVIGAMIADGILEIEVAGIMLSGPSALHSLEVAPPAGDGRSRLGALSRRALDYGAALQIDDPRQLSWRLYTYNCVPASERWHRLWGNPDSVEGYLQINARHFGGTREDRWLRSTPETTDAAWMAWHSVQPAKGQANAPIFKLYVSPAPYELAASFGAIGRALFDSRAFSWKAGNGVYGLLRADKIVAYFHDLADLHAAAAELQKNLGACVAQGVPFTSGIDDRGLLSWGIDRARSSDAVASDESRSWRARLCDLMATALIQACSSPEGSAALADFALQRLRFEGIDPTSWTPTAEFDWYSPSGRA
ncbi:MAG: hypothetical protein JO263_08825 [Candidatus Eremiobacteraeota bacterium]|nr:hypothetical protein [Candidatus Eremiobacteraeota bacterium]